MSNQLKIYDLTKSYFSQQAEIYGRDIYIDFDLNEWIAPHNRSSLVELKTVAKSCQKCALAGTRKNVVFGSGSITAKLMCIGEAPGKEEDLQGEPFVGTAGQLLDKILNAIGFNREEIYIANIIKCRPPDNRTPESVEISECMPYLQQQIEMVKPSIILALGRVAANTLLANSEPLSSLRQQRHKLGRGELFVTYHPAALLRKPELKRDAWQDVQNLRKRYDELVGDKPPLSIS